MRIRLTVQQPISNYTKFWISQSVSLLGSGLTFPLLQLIAAVLLQANAAQIGILVAAASLPSLLVGLFAGAWVDRQKRRPLLIVADLGRFLLLLLLTLSILFHTLTIQQLYIGAFLAGILTLVSDVAYRSYIPGLVQRARLLEANSHFEVSQSATETGGPGIAGALMQICTAPFALVLGAFAFLFSASMVAMLPDVEPEIRQAGAGKLLFAEIHDGLQLVLTNRYLRAIAASIATIGFFYSMLETVFLLRMTREFGFEPGQISLIFAGGGIGFILAAWLTRTLVQRFGFGLVLIGSLLMLGLGNLILAPSLNTKMSALFLLVVGYTLFGFGHTTYNIAQVSLRQAVTPHHLQGRMNATMEFALWGIAPVGALFGGFLGELWGLNTVVWITALGQLAGIGWFYFSPIRALRVHLPPVATSQQEQSRSSLI